MAVTGQGRLQVKTAARYKASQKQDKAQEAWMYLISVGRVTKGHSTEALVSSCTPLRPSCLKSYQKKYTLTLKHDMSTARYPGSLNMLT